MRCLLATTLFAVSNTVLAAPFPALAPGQWILSSSITTPGQSAPPFTQALCIKADAREDVRMHFTSGGRGRANADCTLVDQTISHQRVSFHLLCAQRNNTQISGTISYEWDHYKGKTELLSKAPGSTMRMIDTFTAQRRGNC